MPPDKVPFRTHQDDLFNVYAKLEIWFQANPVNAPPGIAHDLDWVDGKNWAWPRNNLASTIATKNWDFINDAGLNVPGIKEGWRVHLGVSGKHAKAGHGILK
ncbi:hypothetical protein HBH98_008440 [Parastagonospora nodorum]|nr:hypothetical protein HBH54_169990 [Parastagonospora nodorum]KAH3971360.1 hypothetical protein HBH51_112140 [Parastagonospora nodorum]KAH3982256.1 hypothetical protein HBH52_075420 [Parastagonospora nodorum]KAH4077040.1 hypothetical protein HBH46_250150 [Parastagonospora nodorum]KAH4133812.1 hypothetical protein HBH45_173710 [Parastagonospora nodorum]